MSCLTKITKTIEKIWQTKKTGILTGFGVVGIITAPILSGIATYDAIQIVEEEKKRRGVDELEPKEILRLTWRCYILTGIAVGATSGAVIFSNTEATKENANLLSAYLLSEARSRKEREAFAKEIGSEKEEEIHENVLRKQTTDEHNRYLIENPLSRKYENKYWTKDEVTGQEFWSTMGIIRGSMNDHNEMMIHGNVDEVSYSDFLIGCGGKACTISEEVGWSANGALINADPMFIEDESGDPYIVIRHKTGHEPYRGYDKWVNY